MYGYSWDMMIHTWSIQHIRVTYVNKDTGDIGYLNPTVCNVKDMVIFYKYHVLALTEFLLNYPNYLSYFFYN